MMTSEEFDFCMQELINIYTPTSIWLPLAMRHLLLKAPVDVQRSCIKQWQLLNSTSHFPVEGKAHNISFPLPLTFSEDDLKWDATASSPANLQTSCGLQAIHRAWKRCLIFVLKTWTLTPRRTNKNLQDSTAFTPNQMGSIAAQNKTHCVV